MKQLNADLKSGEFKKVYLLYGEEDFLKHSYKNRFRKAIASDGMNYLYKEGKDVPEDDFIDAADTMPFFAERKLIIVEDSGWFKNATDKVADYIVNIPDTTVIVFIESEVDKRNRLYKKVSELGYVCELNHPTEGEITRWAGSILAKAGKKITLPDMQLFISMTGIDMERVRNELEKLIAYTGDREVVNKADIFAITTEMEQNRVFDMVRAISQKKRAEALRLYDDLLTLREPPLRIMFLIAKQFNQLLEVKDMMDQGNTQVEISQLLRIPPSVTDRIMKQVRSQNRQLLLSYVEKCVEMEELVKTGDMPDRLAVEMLICL